MKEKSLKESILPIVLSSTIHGYPNIFEHKTIFFKILWFTFLCCSIAGCSYLITRTLTDYFNYDVVTEYDIVYEVPTEFPCVTICNLDPFVSDYSEDIIKNLLMNIGLSFSSLATLLKSDLKLVQYLLLLNAHATLNDTQKQLLGHPFEKMLISCNFNWKDCSIEDFEWYYDIIYGNCYRFNSGRDMYGNITKKENNFSSWQVSGFEY